MKIGIICYPGISKIDLIGVITPLQPLSQTESDRIQIECCTYLPPVLDNGFCSIQCSHVGLPLTGFDTLILPGYFPVQELDVSPDWIAWLNTASKDVRWLAVNEGVKLARRLNFATIKLPIHSRILNGFLCALWLIQDVKGSQMAWEMAYNLAIEKEWLQANRLLTGRTAFIERKSAETDISISLKLDGDGQSHIDTGIPFLDHMLSQIARHGTFTLDVTARGDLVVDSHHTVEDTGIVLGEAFMTALGDRRGIARMGSATVPMDESLATVTADFSGRPYAVIQTAWNGIQVANLPVSLFEHFLESFATAARCNLFVQVHAGNDNHHMAEAIFKALARALDQASMVDVRRENQIPSTKEVLF